MMKKTVRLPLVCLFALTLLLAFGSAAAFADSLSLPASLTVIEEAAFMGDTSLDEVILPDGLTEIQAGAFSGSSLQSIHIPASVTSIADDAFAGTEPVYYIESPDVFNNNLDDRGTVHLTKNAAVTDSVSFHNTELIVDEGVRLDILGSAEGSELTVCGEMRIYGDITVEDRVSTVGEGFLSVPDSDSSIELPAESYMGALSLRLNRDALLCLTGLDKLASVTDIVCGAAGAEIESGGAHALFRFVPEYSGGYRLCSACDEDVYCQLFSADGERIAYDDDSGEGCNFILDYQDFVAGETYYFDVIYYDTDMSGTIPLSLQFLRIVNQPSDRIVQVGAQAQFSIEAIGEDLHYQWQTMLPGEDEWQDSDAEGSQTDTLTLTVQKELDELWVRCAVTDSEGQVQYSTPARLHVAWRELALGETTAVIANPGTWAAFRFVPQIAGSYTLSSTGDEDTFAILVDEDGNILESNDDSGSDYNFRVRCELEADTVYYYLVRYYSDYITGNLTLELKADSLDMAIRYQPVDMIAAPGRTVCFQLETIGSVQSYQWQVLLPGEESWQDLSVESSDTDTLRFEAQADYDGRQYRCVVTDRYGFTVESDAATLHITEDSVIRRALLIGNQMYTGGELPGCHDDMYAMSRLLQGLTNSFFVTEQPDLTAEQMRNAIRYVFANATENDVSLFYYSGHGCSSVSETDEHGSLLGIKDGYLTPNELAALLSEIPGRVIVVLDSCYSGAMISSKDADQIMTRANQNLIAAFAAHDKQEANGRMEDLRKSKFVVFAAAKPYEESWSMPVDDISCGAFTYAFVTSCGSSYTDGSDLGSIPADTNGDLCLSAAEIHKSAYAAAVEIQPLQHAIYYAANPNEIIFYRN